MALSVKAEAFFVFCVGVGYVKKRDGAVADFVFGYRSRVLAC